MALCITLQSRVLALETTKTTQATEIASLKKRVKKLERRNKSRTHGELVHQEGLNPLKMKSEGVVKIAEERINMVEEVADIIDTAKLVSAVGENINVASIPVSAAATTVTTVDELTVAQALAELKSARPPSQGISFTEPSEATTTTTITITAAPKPPQ
ncbi:hypothetical protein Tco_1160977 [Tanacetum coccineum]